jgi:hypothetical protein
MPRYSLNRVDMPLTEYLNTIFQTIVDFINLSEGQNLLYIIFIFVYISTNIILSYRILFF